MGLLSKVQRRPHVSYNTNGYRFRSKGRSYLPRLSHLPRHRGDRTTTGAQSMCDVSQQDFAGHAQTWYAVISWLDRCKCIILLPLQDISAPLWTEIGFWDCATLHSRRLSNRLSNTNLQLMLSRTITAALVTRHIHDSGDSGVQPL